MTKAQHRFERVKLGTALLILLVATLLLMPFVSLAATESRTIQSKVIASYDPGEFLESLVFDRYGNLYVSLSIAGQIRKISPNGTQTVLASLPVGTGGFGKQSGALGTLTIAEDGTLYATLASTDPNAQGVWQITPQGQAHRIVALPQGAQPNGSVFDSCGNLYVADAAFGQIWRIERGKTEAEVWFKNSLLDPVPGVGFPGANGLKFFHNELYISNSATGNIVRVPLQWRDQPGQPSIYASHINADDFAFDIEGNLYATTHPFNTVVRIGRDRTQVVLATPAQGVIGPAAAAFGTLGRDRTNLYIVTDGGLFGSLIDPTSPTGRPSIVRLTIGIPGYPLRYS